MTVLNEMASGQRTILASLPYRIGLLVSKCDETGGVQAERKERIVLANIIYGFSEDVFGSELLQHIMAETLSRKEEWPDWAENLQADIVWDQCRQALAILRRHADEKEVAAYAVRLMEIGEAVALAFRENGDDLSFPEKLRIYVRYQWTGVRAWLGLCPPKSYDHFVSISPKERKVLRALSDVLGVPGRH